MPEMKRRKRERVWDLRPCPQTGKPPRLRRISRSRHPKFADLDGGGQGVEFRPATTTPDRSIRAGGQILAATYLELLTDAICVLVNTYARCRETYPAFRK